MVKQRVQSALSTAQLLASLEGDGDILINIGKTGRNTAGERLVEWSRKQLSAACDSLKNQVHAAVCAVSDYPEPQTQEEQEALASQLARAIDILRGAALLCVDCLTQCQSDPPPSLLSAAVMLHDNCLLALEGAPHVQDAVAKLCCSWWEQDCPGKDHLLAQTLPYILDRASLSGRVTDIKTCYVMREGFTLLDYDNPSIHGIKRMLLEATMHPAFLHRQEGRRFLAFVFKLHAPMIQELTAIMRNQIPGLRRSVLQAYAEIIFRAWRDSVGCAHQYDIEAACVQDLMQCAISASTQPLAGALRTVLSGVHTQKKMAGVESMLCRLYEPILFRAFEAANADVRRNALLLMLDAFPIRDAEAPPEEMDEIMTQQFQLLQQCLEDDCPTIREIAVQGTLRILNSFWELIPAPVIATFVNKLTGELAYDMAWSGTRVALLGGMIQLVDNPHAQPVLKQALPHLGPLLTDPVVKVREAMAALLSAVSKTRGLHFYEVVPLEMLLAVMSSDVPPVSQAIQQILVPSYFPNPEEGSLHVVNLLKAKPLAGQAFCGHLVSCFEVQPREEADAGDASLDAAFKYTVPIEHILSLFGNLKNHMLATCTSLVDVNKEVAKDKKKKRTAKTSNKKAVAGSKRGGADKSSEQASGPADPNAAADKAIEVEGETVETWASWAAGLAQLAKGLAGAVHRGQCGGLDIAVAMGVDELELLLEACPSLAARLSILDVAATLPFLAASAALRATLYTQLATGSPLCFAKPVPSEGPDPSLLTAVVRCLCSSTGGAKLVAMVIKTLGLRPSKTVHIPVGHCKGGAATDTNEDEDDVRCGACGEAEPSHTMLLCDGCDAAYHMACLKPALHSVPCGDWFCHSCEQEVQACSMAPADLARCINALLQEPGGRGLLHSHQHFGQLLAGLQLQAQQQCQMLTRRLAQAGPQGQDHVTDLAEPAPSKGQGRRKGKAAAPSAQGSAAGQADPHMQGVSSVALLGKAALHMALTSMMAVDEAEEEEEQPNGAGNQGGIAQAQALEASVAMLMEAEDMVEQVVEACCACDAPAPETLCSALGFAADVLGVLCDAQRLTILDMCQAGNSEQVQRLCSVGSDVACMCGKYLDDRRAVGQAAVPVQVTNAFAYTLVMCHQLVSMTSRSSSGRQGGDGSQGPAIHQLEALMDEAASEDRGVGAGLALAGLITTLLQQTLRSKSPSFVATVRPHVNTLLSSTMASSSQVPRSWMSAVAEAVGHALLCSSDVSPASQPSAPAQHLSSSHLMSPTPEGDPEAAWEQQQETDREAAAAEESGEQAAQGTDVKTLQSTSPDTWNLTNHLLQLVKQRDQQELVMDLLASSASASWRAGTVEVTVGSLALLGLLGVKGLRQKRLQLTGTEANVLYTLELLCGDIHTATAQAQAEHTEDAVGVPESEAVAARLLAVLEQLLG
ncbi:condensin II non structural maintenance of chromosomes subunit-domain-containing protein [Haematococcus lacustris]